MEHPEQGMEELGFFGNIWVRQHYLPKVGDTSGGHAHYFDHVTLLAHGSISVSVDGGEPKTFSAPTFIVIKKEKRHKIVALEDDTYYYCVFALRDVDGNVSDIFDEKNVPWYSMIASDNFWGHNDPQKNITYKDVFNDFGGDTNIQNP